MHGSAVMQLPGLNIGWKDRGVAVPARQWELDDLYVARLHLHASCHHPASHLADNRKSPSVHMPFERQARVASRVGFQGSVKAANRT